MPLSRPLLVVCAGLLAGVDLQAQARWSQRAAPGGQPPARRAGEMFFDQVRGTIVLFGNAPESDMWEWDGAAWTQILPANRPSERGTLAYDTTRSRAVLVTDTTGQTWEWDGVDWTQRNPTTSPPPRPSPAMAFDAARDRVVLFGGGIGSFALGDHWEWDGVDWTQRNPAQSPTPRTNTSMAYDSARQRIVLFGGLRASTTRDTWEWDGTTWTRRLAPGPSSSYRHRLVYDAARARVVMFINSAPGSPAGETWEWDGNAWLLRATATAPSNRTYPAMAFDRARQVVVLFGGTDGSSGVGTDDTWEWDGAAWAERSTRVGPEPRRGPRLAYDSARDRVVMFGGANNSALADMWTWEGGQWAELPITSAPPPRLGHSMVYDPQRDRVVLFGGIPDLFPTLNGYLADTWEFDGTAWTRMFPETSPSPRAHAAMFYDAARGVVVLHGGEFFWGEITYSDTWEWNGAAWTQVASGPRATERASHAIAYDPVRERAVMFGGWWEDDTISTFLPLDDTWEWNGDGWCRVQVPTPPRARGSHSMTYDALRDRIVLLGGNGETGGAGISFDDTWEYADGTWTQVVTGSATGTLFAHATAYDSARQELILFGGVDTNRKHRGDTWSYATPDPASYTPFGSSCGTPGARLTAQPASLPWLGATLDLALSTDAPLGLVLGSSRTQWLGANLPLPLGGFGMPGCSLFVSIDSVLAPMRAQAPQWSLAVPSEVALVGARFFVQAFFEAPLANDAGILWSEAGEARIGRR